jgi:uncharacterized protein YgbK (DUF1537 family)
MKTATVIADDLTGAAEIAGLAWSAGVDCQLVMDLEIPDNSGQVMVWNTDTRNCQKQKAVEKIGAILKALPLGKDCLLFKKTDSLLRGVVLPEILQILDSTHFDKALLMPANPSRDRFIRDGRYCIGEHLINETAYKDDPEFPRSDPEVRALINDSVGQIAADSAAWDTKVNRILVPDTGSIDQMREAMDQYMELNVLPAGGADFFKLLIEQWLDIKSKVEIQLTEMPEYLCCIIGSFSGSSDKDVNLLTDHGFVLFEMDAMKEEGSSLTKTKPHIQALFQSNKKVAFRSSSVFQEKEETRLKLLQELTDLAVHLATQTTVPVHFLVTGGRTASLFCKKMLWNRLEISHVEEEGVVTMQYPGSPHFITLKPGSYPWPLDIIEPNKK